MLYYISEGGRKVKVLLYFESEKMLAKSGIGRALDHQKRALTEVGISYTLDEKKIMTSCTSIHTESIVIIWSIKPEEKEKSCLSCAFYRGRFPKFLYRIEPAFSYRKKISGRIVPKSGLSDHANTLFKTVVGKLWYPCADSSYFQWDRLREISP